MYCWTRQTGCNGGDGQWDNALRHRKHQSEKVLGSGCSQNAKKTHCCVIFWLINLTSHGWNHLWFPVFIIRLFTVRQGCSQTQSEACGSTCCLHPAWGLVLPCSVMGSAKGFCVPLRSEQLCVGKEGMKITAFRLLLPLSQAKFGSACSFIVDTPCSIAGDHCWFMMSHKATSAKADKTGSKKFYKQNKHQEIAARCQALQNDSASPELWRKQEWKVSHWKTRLF